MTDNEEKFSAGEKGDILYEVIAGRRCAYDEMLWASPILSLTAQAFLLMLALMPDVQQVPRLIASALAFFSAIASIQLMAKHRGHERIDSDWLKWYEVDAPNGLKLQTSCHGKERQGYSKLNAFQRISSFVVWQVILVMFALAALLTVGLAIWSPNLLSSGGSAT